MGELFWSLALSNNILYISKEVMNIMGVYFAFFWVFFLIFLISAIFVFFVKINRRTRDSIYNLYLFTMII